jgi:hypothetical protein
MPFLDEERILGVRWPLMRLWIPDLGLRVLDANMFIDLTEAFIASALNVPIGNLRVG